MESPRRIVATPPAMIICFNRIDSKIGSSDSGTFSSNTGLPNWIAFSRVRTKLPWFCLTTFNEFASSIFFTHLFAWPCGSIIRGQRLLRKSIMPFSIEKASFGSLLMIQDRMVTGLPSVSRRVKPVEQVIPFEVSRVDHCLIASSR